MTILERAAELSPVGAGLLIQPTGMAVLRELGVVPRVLEVGTRIRTLRGVTSRGRVVLDLAYRDLRADLFGLGVHRGMLFTILQEAVRDAGVEVRCGVEVASLRAVNGSVRVAVDSHGNEHGPFDLVIVADGAKSALRNGCGLVRRSRGYSWGALWFVGEDPDGVYGDTLAQVHRGTGRMIGFLPSGVGPRGVRTVSVFWSVRCDRARVGVEEWKRQVREVTGSAEPVLEQVNSSEQLIFAAYQDVVMRRCVDGPVVFIGDAAHAMSPQLGQGANLALVDAWVLSRSLECGSVTEALDRFGHERRANVRFYQFASRWMTPVFQSGWEWAALLRGRAMGPMCHHRWLRGEMLKSLAGVKTGIFRSGAVPEPMVQ